MTRSNILALYGVLIVVAVGVAIGAMLSQWVPVWYIGIVALVVIVASFISATVIAARGGKS